LDDDIRWDVETSLDVVDKETNKGPHTKWVLDGGGVPTSTTRKKWKRRKWVVHVVVYVKERKKTSKMTNEKMTQQK